MYTRSDHTFAICAYKESPFLEECIDSVKPQGSSVIVCTSTPCEYIQNIADRHSLKLFIRDGKSNIADDWNFAVSSAETELVTITHQDDLYKSNYLSEMLDAVNKSSNPVIFFSDYEELRDGETVTANRLLKIKKTMKLPIRINNSSRLTKRAILAFGNSICCPSVTYLRQIAVEHPFKNNMRSNIDWQLWEELSKEKGSFVYLPKALMQHRIHEGSETSGIIRDNQRGAEDLYIFKKFWPEPVARFISGKYKASEESNSTR